MSPLWWLPTYAGWCSPVGWRRSISDAHADGGEASIELSFCADAPADVSHATFANMSSGMKRGMFSVIFAPEVLPRLRPPVGGSPSRLHRGRRLPTMLRTKVLLIRASRHARKIISLRSKTRKSRSTLAVDTVLRLLVGDNFPLLGSPRMRSDSVNSLSEVAQILINGWAVG